MNDDQTTGVEPESTNGRMEIAIAIMLGVAAIVTAWCSFQSGLLNGEVQKSYSEGIRSADAASQAYNMAVSNDIRDEALFLEFAKAAQNGDEETATYILDTLMSPELAAAVGWWSEQPDEAGYDSPFVEDNPNWSTALFDEAEALDETAQSYFDAAEKSDRDGDAFDQLTVVLAVALFFLGIAGLSRQRRVMIGLASIGVVIVASAILRAVVLGDPGGVL